MQSRNSPVQIHKKTKSLPGKQCILDHLQDNYLPLLSYLFPDGRVDNRNEYHHLCPYHDDHSLGNSSTSVKNGRGKCFACDARWDIFHLVGKIYGISSFPKQLQQVAELSGIEPFHRSYLQVERLHKKSGQYIDLALIDRYVSNMNPQHFAYLQGKRVISSSTATRYKIGFFQQRYTLPVFNQTGHVINIRKWLPPDARNGNSAKIVSFAPGYGSIQLYPIDQLGAESLILTEGELDALAVISSGFTAITVTGGADSWQDDFSQIIAESGCRKIIICMDNDSAGQNGAIKRAQSLSDYGLKVSVISWPKAFKVRGDVTDLLLEYNGKQNLKKLIDKAKPFKAQISLSDRIDQQELDTPEWPKLDVRALHGLAGEFVQLATENSEADPVAVLATFLVRFGVEVDRGPVLMVGDTPHRTRLASVIVGASSKARKGTSVKPVLKLFKNKDDGLMLHPARVSPGPFSSGEGIIYAVRDQMTRWNDKKQIHVVIDPGVEDKRLFILDEEFAGALANTRREGNTLSMVLRAAWDSGNLDPLTKTVKTCATNAHIGWVSHITLHELGAKLSESEGFNGFANRILWVCARRSKRVPFPEPMDEERLSVLRNRVAKILLKQNRDIIITLNDPAKQAWSNLYYDQLSEDRPGLIGCITNRAEAQVLRLAMVYCLLDGKNVIDLACLEAALSFWEYCRQSAQYIFHGQAADRVGQKILEILDTGKKTGRELFSAFSNNISKKRLEGSLKELIGSGRVTTTKLKTGRRGRPTVIYELRETVHEKNE